MITGKVKYGSETFELVLHGKFTFIVGSSGTGKTHLASIIDRAGQEGINLAIGDGLYLRRFSDLAEEALLDSQHLNKAIFVIDEEDISRSRKGADALYAVARKVGSYFLVTARELPSGIPFGLGDLYYLHRSGHYHKMVPVVSQGDPVFDLHEVRPDLLLTEDKKSGFMAMCAKYGSEIVATADGRNNILPRVKECDAETTVTVYADLCGTGNCSLTLLSHCQRNHNIHLIPSRSFEYDALHSRVFRGRKIEEYTKSFERPLCESEEDYYTRLLNDFLMDSNGLKYSKGSRKALDYLLRDRKWIPDIAVNSSSLNSMSLED